MSQANDAPNYCDAWKLACAGAADGITRTGELRNAALIYGDRQLIMPMAFAETRESINEWWNMLRAVCVGVDAQCVITVAEAWLSYDTSVRPSVSASRREVVAVSAAWRAADTGLIEQRMSYREVARAPDGSVTGLSDEVSGGGDADTPIGEILGIRASRIERKAAKALIRHMEKSGGLELIPPATRH